jgi:hypothetical protein
MSKDQHFLNNMIIYTERRIIPSIKNKQDGYVEYESLGEATNINLHDHDPNCYLIESQPVELPNKSGKGIPYTIDFLAKESLAGNASP